MTTPLALLPPLRKQRDYRLLWTSRAVTETGTAVSTLAVPLTAASLLGASPLQMGILSAATSAPYLLIGLPAGALADRLARRRPLMMLCEGVAGTAMLSVPVAWLLGVLSIHWLIVVAMIVGFAAVFYSAASPTHTRRVVDPSQMTEAIAGMQAVYSVAHIGGPSLGGVLVSALTAPLAMFVDALSFFGSLLCLRAIRTPDTGPTSVRTGLWLSTMEGLRITLRQPTLRALFWAAVITNFCGAAQMAVYVLFALHDAHLPVGLVGLLSAAGGAGGLVGATIAPRLARRYGEARLMLFVLIFEPVAYFTTGTATGPVAVASLIIIGAGLAAGLGAVTFGICFSTLLIRTAPAEALGRVNATVSFGSQGVLALGGLAGGVAAEVLGLRTTILLTGVLAATALFFYWFSPLRTARRPVPAS